MKISEILNSKERTLSFEVFPPKTSTGMDNVLKATKDMAVYRPDFMSVTYGAGGGTSDYTVNVAASIQQESGIPVLPHLTCVSSDRAKVKEMIKTYKERGIENIMALRGDLPEDGQLSKDYKYAIQLIQDIKADSSEICIGAACYPEGHPEAATRDEDIKHLKEKVDAGVDFLTTQMFFDNNIFYHFLYRVREAGINVPVLAGIMPITNVKQFHKSISITGTIIPERFKAIVDRFGSEPDAMFRAGVIYAAEQITDLYAHGIRNIHVYSMNKPSVAGGIKEALKGIV